MSDQTYYYAGNCTETDNGMAIQEITGQDHDDNPEYTYGHPEEYAITRDQFITLTGINKEYDFYGKNGPIVFAYDSDEDIHYFYTRSGTIDLS